MRFDFLRNAEVCADPQWVACVNDDVLSIAIDRVSDLVRIEVDTIERFVFVRHIGIQTCCRTGSCGWLPDFWRRDLGRLAENACCPAKPRAHAGRERDIARRA